MAFNLKSHDR